MKKTQAYKIIKQMIMRNRFTQKQLIDINQLAKELNMSRTPIQKALTQLEQEGYVTITPQVGVFIKLPTLDELHERLAVVVAIDVYMAQCAAKFITKEQLKKISNILDLMENVESEMEYEQLDHQFHRIIYQSSNNNYAFNLNKSNWDYLRYVRFTNEIFKDKFREQSQLEHRLIVQALQERDVILVRDLMERHLRRAEGLVIDEYRLSKTANLIVEK
ncbi:GntR family transcriptional regulator [Psychrobacillus sp. FJAT-51614]|uniref:GntR family transcriptional regulator n=1 Tax=Psychrobacillus mangrovi TaxID=3117745 RepID=A0ABU8FAF2_9BACI